MTTKRTNPLTLGGVPPVRIGRGVIYWRTPLYVEIDFKSMAALDRWTLGIDTDDDHVAGGRIVIALTDLRKDERTRDFVHDHSFGVLFERRSGNVVGPAVARFDVPWSHVLRAARTARRGAR
jgi:hypothetical protein